ncbi:spore germination protein [Cohnella faecalis]|uniref:Spore germination protein n=2 Tax=Cohnella faecalis TaxID=2315694 RepID=A0A398CJI7_9BACL|nr:spore germination protein [Cohnella faecalis]RIE02515.1 spore germination protein [Cohnella faecalis]
MPQNEKTVRGPQDAFVEDIWTNLSLIRQRIKTTDLKVDSFELGTESKTLVLLLYMKSKCEPRLVKEVGAKLNGIHVEGLFGSNMVEEYLDTNKFSPFPQSQYTERPDAAITALIEGKVVILVNGTPNQLILPASLVAFLQAAEDYYQRFFFSSWIRLIRYLFFAVSLILPSAYVAITTFHPEMIPVSLLISVASSRDLVPFPAVFEAFAMELTFEVLREAGQRIPAAMGQTISIVGALVIGEAAVQAGIVSAPMVIVVSLTGISSFIIPHFELNLAVRLLRFSLLILAGMFGLLGLLIGIILILTHLIALEPFGVPYLSPLVPLDRLKLGDVLIRLPWTTMMKLKQRQQQKQKQNAE